MGDYEDIVKMEDLPQFQEDEFEATEEIEADMRNDRKKEEVIEEKWEMEEDIEKPICALCEKKIIESGIEWAQSIEFADKTICGKCILELYKQLKENDTPP